MLGLKKHSPCDFIYGLRLINLYIILYTIVTAA